MAFSVPSLNMRRRPVCSPAGAATTDNLPTLPVASGAVIMIPQATPQPGGVGMASCTLEKRHHRIHALPCPAVGEHERPTLANQLRIPTHHVQVRADVWREVNFVDHQEVGEDQARAPFARYLVASRDVDDIEVEVDQLRAESQRQVVAAALDEREIGQWKAGVKLGQRRQVHRRILANGSVRARTGLNADHTILFDHAAQHAFDVHLVFAGEDVVGHHDHGSSARHQQRHHPLDQGGLARADRPADAHANRMAHEANSLAARRSWRAAARSRPGANGHSASHGIDSASSTARWISGWLRRMTAWTSPWPTRSKRIAATASDETKLYE